ncbi:phytochrome B [Tanacetum coccineum]|uniref:Phytochrome B n=1 Tax=Tanacetum coccineum TaxID=301880 RepID=A0ABQ5BW77_9ASTR
MNDLEDDVRDGLDELADNSKMIGHCGGGDPLDPATSMLSHCDRLIQLSSIVSAVFFPGISVEEFCNTLIAIEVGDEMGRFGDETGQHCHVFLASSSQRPTLRQSFVAGFVAAIASNPVAMIKTRVLNVKVAEGVNPPYKGAVDCAVNTVKAKGQERAARTTVFWAYSFKALVTNNSMTTPFVFFSSAAKDVTGTDCNTLFAKECNKYHEKRRGSLKTCLAGKLTRACYTPKNGNMKMEPDIENMTICEYLEYEPAKGRRLWDDVRSRRSPTHYDETDFNSFHQNKSNTFYYSYSHYLPTPPVQPYPKNYLVSTKDITVKDVERIKKFFNVPDEIDKILQPLIPEPIHTTPPNDDYVAPATKSILDEILEEFKDEISNVTMVDDEANFNPTKDLEELERLLAKEPQSNLTEIQVHSVIINTKPFLHTQLMNPLYGVFKTSKPCKVDRDILSPRSNYGVTNTVTP